MWTIETAMRILVIAMYGIAAIAAIAAYRKSYLWVRKTMSLIIIGISSSWMGFYLYLLIDRWHEEPSHGPATVSRILHYLTAAGLYVIASFLLQTSADHGRRGS